MTEPYIDENFHLLVGGMMTQHQRFIYVPSVPLMNELYIKAIDSIKDETLKLNILLEYLLEYMVSEPIKDRNIRLFKLPAVKAAVQGANFDALTIHERALLIRNTTLAILVEACRTPLDLHTEMNALFQEMPGWNRIITCIKQLKDVSDVNYYNTDMIEGLLSSDDQSIALPGML